MKGWTRDGGSDVRTYATKRASDGVRARQIIAEWQFDVNRAGNGPKSLYRFGIWGRSSGNTPETAREEFLQIALEVASREFLGGNKQETSFELRRWAT